METLCYAILWKAQADFGEAWVIVAGVKCKAHYFAMDLPQSDDCFVAAFPAETTEAFLEGHVRAFAYFEGVPRQILYDNTKLAVAKILGGGERYPSYADESIITSRGKPAAYPRRDRELPKVSSWEYGWQKEA